MSTKTETDDGSDGTNFCQLLAVFLKQSVVATGPHNLVKRNPCIVSQTMPGEYVKYILSTITIST